MVFKKKTILIPNVAEKKILILVEEKKKSDSEFLSYNLMLNSGKKVLPLVLSEENFLNETKNHNPPFKLNGRSIINYNIQCHGICINKKTTHTF
jgi:hypothetical protein